jgi:hypothetical protein
MGEWRFWASKKRQFSPFFSSTIPGSGTGFVVGQAFEPDIPKRRAGKPDLLGRPPGMIP